MTTFQPTHRTEEINGIRLHFVEGVDRSLGKDPPLVVLLHGFPEFWHSWRHQIPALVAAGFHVVAPDMRGYNLSEKPRGTAAYTMDRLTDDVAGLILHMGHERAHVVGHDWGGAAAWNVPRHHPSRVGRLAILNSPHPRAFLRELRTLSQLRRSWYMFFFQLPLLPEWCLRFGDFAVLERMLRRDPARPGCFSDDEIRLYKEALARPGALTATLDYYRALRHKTRRVRSRIETPTLLIWGERDRYLGPALTRDLERWVPNLTIKRIPTASHWVQMDAPEEVNEALLDFLRRPL